MTHRGRQSGRCLPSGQAAMYTPKSQDNRRQALEIFRLKISSAPNLGPQYSIPSTRCPATTPTDALGILLSQSSVVKSVASWSNLIIRRP
jgi:hypothetical protein